MGAIDYQNRNVTLDALASSTANARAMGKGKGIEALAAQIAAQGLIQPLTVFKAGGTYHVDAGHRRLAAIRLLAERGQWDGPVPCRVIPAGASDTDRRAISYVENLGQLPMHPLDRMRVLSGFVRRGIDAGQIAARFGITEAEVAKVLTLSNLALPIRKALAEGRLSEDRALIYAEADRGAQMAAFQRFGMVGDPRVIRSTLRQGQGFNSAPMSTGDRLFRFVSDEYTAAGGAIASDLFTAEGTVDGGLVRKLAEAKLREFVAAEKAREEAEDGNLRIAFTQTSLGDMAEAPGLTAWEDYPTECPVPLGILGFVPRYGSATGAAEFVIRVTDWHAYEEAERARANEAEADAAEDEAPQGWGTVDTSTEDQDEDGDGLDNIEDEAPAAPAYDPEAEARAPSQPMLQDAAAALTAALVERVTADPRAALDAFLFSALADASSRSPLDVTLHGRRRDLPVFLAGVDRRSDDAAIWAKVDALTEDQRAEAFAFFVANAVRATVTASYIPAQTGPLPAARALAVRVGVNMHADWSKEDRKAYLGRMTKRDLACVVLGLEGIAADEAQAMGKAELVERAMAARWVPPFFAGIEAETTRVVEAEAEPEAAEAEAEAEVDACEAEGEAELADAAAAEVEAEAELDAEAELEAEAAHVAAE